MDGALGFVDVFNETFDAAGEGEVFFFAIALIDQFDFHAVIEKTQFAQALGENVVMKFNASENFFIGHEVNFGAAFVGGTGDLHRRAFETVDHLDHTVLRNAFLKVHGVDLAVTLDDHA